MVVYCVEVSWNDFLKLLAVSFERNWLWGVNSYNIVLSRRAACVVLPQHMAFAVVKSFLIKAGCGGFIGADFSGRNMGAVFANIKRCLESGESYGMDNEKLEITRREFLAWLAAGVAMVALPGSGHIANAAAPTWVFADLDLPMVDSVPGNYLVIPDPPPPIVNPPRGVTHISGPQQASASSAGNPEIYAQYNAQYSNTAAATAYANAQAAAYNRNRSGGQTVAASYQPQDYQQAYQPASMESAQRVRLSAARSTAPAAVAPVAVAPVAVAPAAVSPAVVSAPAPMMTAMPPTGEKVKALSRRMWANVAANPGKMRPMGQVKRITIHHEGSEKPNNDIMPFDVVATLRLIHSQHRQRMGAGDIGYHFIIDRTGMIWQGRDWTFQGAHTSGANVNNLGVMLLGNFEIQRPTQPQLDSLNRLTVSLVRKFGLNPSKDIYGHGDLCKTQCPGSNLRPQVDALRRM